MSFIQLVVWAIFAALSMPQVALSQTSDGLSKEGLRLVTVTGRAAIIHEDALDEARDMALEDALYYVLYDQRSVWPDLPNKWGDPLVLPLQRKAKILLRAQNNCRGGARNIFLCF